MGILTILSLSTEQAIIEGGTPAYDNMYVLT